MESDGVILRLFSAIKIKMRKIILTLIIVGIVFTTHAQLRFSYGGDNFIYTVIGSSEVELTEYNNSAVDDVDIPSRITYKGTSYKVTSIADNAFHAGCSSVSIPNTIRHIGKGALYTGDAISISVAKDNPVYDSRDNCNAIIHTQSNTLIAGCGNTRIPNSVKAIGDYAFYWCDLTSIYIPNSVTSIGEGAFWQCENLTTITMPNTITTIGNSAFENCSRLTSITIPNSVITIGIGAFAKCSRLASIVIPNSVISIGNNAFYGCDFTNINIPNSVTAIGDGAFTGCSRLTSISVEKGNPVYDSRDNCNAIIHTQSNKLINGCKNTHIPNTITAIGNCAFLGSGLNSITIPNSVTSIGDSSFFSCNHLTNIDIPNSVTYIGSAAFAGCISLSSITIPNTVSSIGKNTFAVCTDLKFVYIPNSVTSIGESAFWDCGSLKSITIPNSVLYIGDGAFDDCRGMNDVVIEKTHPVYTVRKDGVCISIVEKNTDREVTKICND